VKKAHTRGSIYIAACRTVCAIALCRFDSTSSGHFGGRIGWVIKEPET